MASQKLTMRNTSAAENAGTPTPRGGGRRRPDPRGNQRLTAMTGAVLLVLALLTCHLAARWGGFFAGSIL